MCAAVSTAGVNTSPQFQSDEIYSLHEDSLLLLKAARAEAMPTDLTIEIGCGSGFVSQELSSSVRCLVATDINPHAVRATKARGIEVVRTDLFLGIKGKFDLILFNPPYLPTTAEEKTSQWINYALDGGESGMETINRFLRDLRGHLRPGGRALLLISSLTGLRDVRIAAMDLGLAVEDVASEKYFFEQLHVLRLEAAL